MQCKIKLRQSIYVTIWIESDRPEAYRFDILNLPGSSWIIWITN